MSSPSSLTSFPWLTPTKKNNNCTTSSKPRCRPRISLQSSSSTPPNPNLLKSITNLLWGKSLPPQLLISTVHTSWNATWHLMMSQLAPSDPATGHYSRPTSQFRSNSLGPLPTKLHLYVGLPCPWAHRALIVRALKGLERAVPVSVASPGMDGSWEFKEGAGVGSTVDGANGLGTLKEVYRSRRGGYDGRATVPMLWDVVGKEVVCNESYDIVEIFNSGMNEVAENAELDLAPRELRQRIQEWNALIYPAVNNGVYR